MGKKQVWLTQEEVDVLAGIAERPTDATTDVEDAVIASIVARARRPDDSGMILSVLQTKVGVSMGDHGQDVVTAHAVDPSEQVGDVVERLLTESALGRFDQDTKTWSTVRKVPQHDWYLTVRVVQMPEPEMEEDGRPIF